MTILVETNGVTFTDSLGCDALTVSFPLGKDPFLPPSNGTVATASDFFVYVGALRSEEHEHNATLQYQGAPTVVGGSGFASIEVSGVGALINVHDGSEPCPQMNDCEVTLWSNWSKCSLPCGPGGNYERTREIDRPAKMGGATCPSLFEREPCDLRT